MKTMSNYEELLGKDSERVSFRFPDYDKIKESGLTCVDMHFHTCFSDSYTRVSNALSLAKKRGVGLAITDHNLIGGVLKAYELNDKDGPLVIPGVEISTWGGPHILVYFYSIDEMKEYWEKNVKPYLARCPWLAIDKGTEWVIDSLEDVNCVVSGAHPLGYLASVKGIQKAIDHGRLDADLAKRLDAYEVICSGMFRNENIKAWEHADEYGIGYTGGSDGHLLSELGNVLTISEADSVDGFLDDIRKHRNAVMGHEKFLITKMIMAMTSLSRFATKYPISSFAKDIELIWYHGTKDRPVSGKKEL